MKKKNCPIGLICFDTKYIKTVMKIIAGKILNARTTIFTSCQSVLGLIRFFRFKNFVDSGVATLNINIVYYVISN